MRREPKSLRCYLATGHGCHESAVGSAQPAGKPADGAGTVMIESGISELTAAALRQKGHNIVRAKGAFGGYQGIRIDWKNGTLHGGTDPRKDGAAVGY
jgi:gamma-glutamyltranspeptidase/glutathione hydrolase